MGSDEYVMVPREPTEEMLRAGLVGVEEPAAPLVGMRRLSNAYRAMLSAALPSAPSGEPVAWAVCIDPPSVDCDYVFHSEADAEIFAREKGETKFVIQPLYAAPSGDNVSTPSGLEDAVTDDMLNAAQARLSEMRSTSSFNDHEIAEMYLAMVAANVNVSTPSELEGSSAAAAGKSREDKLIEAWNADRQRFFEARDALYQFKYPPDPKLLREIADEIDCGNDCAHGYTEWDSNAHVCSRSERKEGCAGEKASCLRQFADAIGIRSAAVDQTGGVTSPDYVMVPKQELGSIIYDIENGFTETAMKQLEKLLSAAPPSPRSDDGDGKPVAWQWKQTDPFSGAPFWHHDQYYNGNRSEVSRPLYLRPSPTRDETIEMCAKWHDEQAAQYDVKRQEWIERGLILAADKCDDLSDNHRRHAASIRSLKSTPDAEGE